MELRTLLVFPFYMCTMEHIAANTNLDLNSSSLERVRGCFLRDREGEADFRKIRPTG